MFTPRLTRASVVLAALVLVAGTALSATAARVSSTLARVTVSAGQPNTAPSLAESVARFQFSATARDRYERAVRSPVSTSAATVIAHSSQARHPLVVARLRLRTREFSPPTPLRAPPHTSTLR